MHNINQKYNFYYLFEKYFDPRGAAALNILRNTDLYN